MNLVTQNEESSSRDKNSRKIPSSEIGPIAVAIGPIPPLWFKSSWLDDRLMNWSSFARYILSFFILFFKNHSHHERDNSRYMISKKILSAWETIEIAWCTERCQDSAVDVWFNVTLDCSQQSIDKRTGSSLASLTSVVRDRKLLWWLRKTFWRDLSSDLSREVVSLWAPRDADSEHLWVIAERFDSLVCNSASSLWCLEPIFSLDEKRRVNEFHVVFCHFCHCSGNVVWVFFFENCCVQELNATAWLLLLHHNSREFFHNWSVAHWIA